MESEQLRSGLVAAAQPVRASCMGPCRLLGTESSCGKHQESSSEEAVLASCAAAKPGIYNTLPGPG